MPGTGTKAFRAWIGFSSSPREDDDDLDSKIYRVATEAARRRFSSEFMNRIDKVIVFRALQRAHLEEILGIELARVQERIMSSTGGRQFILRCTNRARDLLLREGTDMKFGARHLKRAIERYLVFPLSNLMATRQVQLGDLVTVDCHPASSKLVFLKEEQGALQRAWSSARRTGSGACFKWLRVHFKDVGAPSAMQLTTT